MWFPAAARKVTRAVPVIIQAIAAVIIIRLVGEMLLDQLKSKEYLGVQSRGKMHAIKMKFHHPPHHAPHHPPKKIVKQKKLKINKDKIRKLMRPNSNLRTTSMAPDPPYNQEMMVLNRSMLLEETCQKYKLGEVNVKKYVGQNLTRLQKKTLSLYPKVPLYQRLYVTSNNNFAFCPLSMVAQTELKKLLLSAAGENNRMDPKDFASKIDSKLRAVYPFMDTWEEYEPFLKQSRNVIFVRHPFLRLLASYKYLLEKPSKGNTYYYTKFAKPIMMQYRLKKQVGMKGPTFEEFTRYLLNTNIKDLDEVWKPFYWMCSVCLIPYNVVGKTESFNWDYDYTAIQMNLTQATTIPFGDGVDMQEAALYYPQLNSSQLTGLYELYWLDFEMFGYSSEPFFDLIRQHPDLADGEHKMESPVSDMDPTAETGPSVDDTVDH